MTSEKAWPLSKCSIVLDWSLVDSSSQWPQGTNSSFEISQVCVEGDVIQLDPSIDDALTKKLLQGGSLNVPITSYFVSSSMVDQANTSIATSRALSRLKKVFLNFSGSTDAKGTFRYPGDNFKVGVRVGGTRYPQHDIENNVDAHLHLKNCLGHNLDGRMALNITPAEWKSTKYTLGLRFEKDESFGSGLSLKQGELYTTMMTGIDTSAVNECFVIMKHDVIISIMDQGAAQVFD